MGSTGINGTNTIDQYAKTGQVGGNGGPLTDIHFGYNDYTIQPQDSSILRANADWLTQHPAAHVQVEGNCDDRGSEEYNIALGAKRAQSAKDYLTTLGISGDRISTISYGKELPVCTEQTDDCWAQNRRDHFAVSQAQ
jgi:peptidoglycan-associated lipoprotein